MEEQREARLTTETEVKQEERYTVEYHLAIGQYFASDELWLDGIMLF